MRNYFFLFLLLFPSCVPQRCSDRSSSVDHKNIKLYLEMPDNKLVFENYSSLVYSALWDHFDRVGFCLVDSSRDAFRLKVTLKNIESVHKFLSPDLLSYAVKMRIDLFCQLYDSDGQLVDKKLFSFATLIPKAQDHVLNSSFEDDSYRQLMKREAYKIDLYFRRKGCFS